MARVLVVDDNAANRDLVVTLLGYRGHTALEAADGKAALAIAKSEPVDLIITDLLMPDMDGYELVRELRADPDLAETPVIFYTAYYLQDELRSIASTLGVGHRLSKPINPEDLFRAVDDALHTPTPVAPVAVPVAELDREHLRALSGKLVRKVEELEQAESALEASEARFRALAEFSPLGIFSMTAHGEVSYANPRLMEICALTRAAGELKWDSIVHPEDRERLRVLIAGASTTPAGGSARLRLLRPDGEQRWVAMQVAPVADATESPIFVGTVEDVTEMIDAQREREEMEGRLRISERLESLGHLSAGIAHDFNNVLAVIVNCVEFVEQGLSELERDYPDERWAQLHEDAATVSSAAARAAELTHRLLVFARRDVVRPVEVDVDEMVESVAQLLTRTIGEQVQLNHTRSGNLHPVLADRSQLEQVIMNLVVNARDAVGEGGTVSITTDEVRLHERDAALHAGAMPGRYVRVTVRDDGAGMSSETIAQAFEPFFTTKPVGQGTGLGLSTVYGIVARMGGNVTIDSEEGVGTSVQVYLPALAADRRRAGAGVAAVASAAERAGAGRVILVAEDDDELRAVTARILTENGYVVVPVSRGTEALALLSDESKVFDLLLSDVVMPQMSGRDLAERTASIRPSLPVLFMSGYAGQHLNHVGDAGGQIDFLEKPFSPSSLLSAVARALPGSLDPEH